MPFSRQIRSNSTSPVPGPNRPVNTLPLSVRICCGTPWLRIANANASHVGRAVARAHHQRRDTEPRVVIDPGHDLRFATIDEPHPAHDVHLPQLHRPRPFPPLVVRLLASPRLRGDQPVTDQTPIDRRPRPAPDRHPHGPADDRSCADPTPDAPPAAPRSAPPPPGSSDADTTPGTVDPSTSPARPPRRVRGATSDAPSDGSPRTGRDLGDRDALVQHLEHRLIALLHHTELHQHDDTSRLDNVEPEDSPSASRA